MLLQRRLIILATRIYKPFSNEKFKSATTITPMPQRGRSVYSTIALYPVELRGHARFTIA